jgi:hypothetical protein
VVVLCYDDFRTSTIVACAAGTKAVPTQHSIQPHREIGNTYTMQADVVSPQTLSGKDLHVGVSVHFIVHHRGKTSQHQLHYNMPMLAIITH